MDDGEFETSEEEADADANSDLLDMDEMKEEEDDSTFLAPHLRPLSGLPASRVDGDLYVVCRRAASNLSIPWTATHDAEGTE